MCISILLVIPAIRTPTHLVGMRAKAKVLHSLTRVLGTTEENNVRTSRGTHSELIESDALAAGLLNARARGRGEAEGADGHLRDLVEAVVIGDGADDGADLALEGWAGDLVGGHADDLGEGKWWSDLGVSRSSRRPHQG